MNFCPECGTRLVMKEIDAKSRQACPQCPFVFWDNPVPIVAAIVERDNAVILVRNAGWPEKMFGLVCGFLEKGETPDEAVLREVKEELVLDSEIVDFVGYYPFLARNQIIFTYHVRAQGDIVLDKELAEYRIVMPEKLRPWPFGTGPAVRDWLIKKGYSPD